MRMTAKDLGIQHLEAVDSLMKRNGKMLGFLPKEALRDYFRKGGVLGVIEDEDKVVGYLLYATHSHRFRIVHLCVEERLRGKGIARKLIDALKEKSSTQNFIKLHCRRDFPANDMWPKLGFFALHEKTGRSRAGHTLVQWHLTLAPDDQLSLFQEKTCNSSLDVVIDAQILFNLIEPDSDKTRPSKALYNDYSEHTLFLQITEETYNEINRSADDDRRKHSRLVACKFPMIKYDSELVQNFERNLKEVLPKHTESKASDIRHLAITASSETRIFVTEDRFLLRKAEAILQATGLQVLSPARLITRIHEMAESKSYRKTRTVSYDFAWRRISSDDLLTFPYEKFLKSGETKGRFRERLETFLSSPNRFKSELLQSDNDIMAIRIMENDLNSLIIHLVRVTKREDRTPLKSFLVADAVWSAIKKKVDAVMFENELLTPNLMTDYRRMGFQKHNRKFVKFCFTGNLDRPLVLSRIRKRWPEYIDVYDSMSDRELEKSCSPVNILTGGERYLLIPIKPDYAMSLTDRLGSADDLFGGKTRTLLRWDNVYYRSNTHRNILKPSSLILWYASQPRKEVVALSHLDEVETGPPGILFRKYRKFGVFEWREIYRICKEDPSREIMALLFSHTFPLRKTIPLSVLRRIYDESDKNLFLQSISKIPEPIFRKLYHLGFVS